METLSSENTITKSKDWKLSKLSDQLYSADVVIDAYLKGKKDSLEDAQRGLLFLLDQNLKTTFENTEKVLKTLKKKKFSPISAYIRICSWNTFDVLITLPEKEFISDKFLVAYDLTISIEEKVNSDHYSVSFSFTDTAKAFDYNQLQSDGYILEHPLKPLVKKV